MLRRGGEAHRSVKGDRPISADGFVSAPAQQQRAEPARLTLFAAALLSWLTVAVLLHSEIATTLLLTLLCGIIILLCGIIWLLTKRAGDGLLVKHPGELLKLRQRLLLLRLRSAAGFLLFAFGVTAIIVCQLFVQEQQRERAVSQLTAHTKQQPVELVEYPKQKQRQGGESTNWVTAKTLTEPAGVRVLLWLRKPAPAGWAPGTTLLVTGSVKDQPRTSATAYSISVKELTETAAGGSTPGPPGLLKAVNSAAATLRSKLTAVSAQLPGAQLVPGFATGDTSLVTAQQQQQLLDTSLTHLVAVSGANCALVIVAVSKIFSALGANRAVRNTAALIGLTGFVLLIGPDSSVLRAAVMAAICLIARFGTVGINGSALLGFAVVLLLWFDPWQASKPGFILSVAATAAILSFTDPIRKKLQRLQIPGIIAMPLSVTVAAQLGCTPFLLLLSDGITVLGVVANLLAAPVAPLATGFSLLALIGLTVSESLGQLLMVPATICSNLVLQIAAWLGDISVATKIPWPKGVTGALTLCAIVGLLLVFRKVRKPAQNIRSQAQKFRSKSRLRLSQVVEIAGYAAAAVLVSLNVIVQPHLGSGAVPSDWAVVGCDIGQGDAILIRNTTDPETVILVDTGDDPDLLRRCLNDFGVRRIALLVLSHDDRDHVGALSTVSAITEQALIAPRTLGQAERTVVKQLENAGIPFQTGGRTEPGSRADIAESTSTANNGSVGLISWEMLGPKLPFYSSETNAASLIMRVETGELSILLLGDSNEEGHKRLLREFAPDKLAVDVLKVSHHGSKDASPALTAASQAKYAIVSVGADNSYGHPAPRSIDSYRASNMVVLRTDLHGHVVVRADKNLSNWVEKPPE